VGTGSAIAVWLLAGRHLASLPGGAPASQMQTSPAGAQGVLRCSGPPRSRWKLVRDPRFLTIALAFGLGIFAQIGVSSHLIPRLAPVMGSGAAAVMVSVCMACATLGRSILGLAVGETRMRLIACANFALLASGTLVLALAQDSFPLVLGPVLTGIAAGSSILLMPLIAHAEFGPRDAQRAIAMISAANQAALAIAPSATAWLQALTGSYTMPFCLAAAIELVAAGCVLASPRSRTRAAALAS
jgi:predicted MFS family arabinose efflux permease